MEQIQIAPGHWLYAPAAASWARMRRAGMPAGGITEAGRSRARQEYLYAQYLAGRLIAYAARPGTSKHESGRAVDMQTASAAHAWLISHGAAHGWTRPLLRAAKPEPWHWEYSVVIDRHLTDGADPVPDLTPVTPPAPLPPMEDDMYLISAPGRGQALIGPGYYRHLVTPEEVEAAAPIVTRTLAGNDRQWDLWRSLALEGTGATVALPAVDRLIALVEALPQDQWWDVTVRRGDEQVPVIQELADIKTLLLGRAGA